MEVLTNKKEDLIKASKLLLEGKLVAFPTETVFGVSCIFNNYQSYINLNKLKNRNPDKPYTLMLSNPNDISKYAYVSNKANILINKFMPGSITIILKAKKDALKEFNYKGDYVGFRVPSNKTALDLLKLVKLPLMVPSLNKANKEPLNDLEDIKKEFENELDAIIFEEIKKDLPSTVFVVDENDNIKIIREGKISKNLILNS